MSNPRRYRSKPPIGTKLDFNHQLTRNLSWFTPCWEGTGLIAADIISGNNLILNNPATCWVPGNSPTMGSGILCSGAGNGATSGPWSTRLQTAFGPLSLVVGFRWNGITTGNFANLFGLCSSNAASTSSQPCIIQYSGGTQAIRAYLNSGSSIPLTSFSLRPNVDYIVILTIIPFAQAITKGYSIIYLYGGGHNGPVAWGAGINNQTTWNNTSAVFCGTMPGATTVASNVVYYFGAIYNRGLTNGEANAWGANPWQIFRPRLDPRLYQNTSQTIFVFSTANFNCAGDVVNNDGYMASGGLKLIHGDGILSINNGVLTQIEPIFACAGDFSISNNGRISNLNINLSNSGDVILNNARLSQFSLSLNPTAILIENDGRLYQFSTILNGAGDLVENGGRLSQSLFALSGVGNLVENDGRLSQFSITLNGAGDLIQNDGRISQLSSIYSGAGDYQLNPGVRWGDDLYFNSAGDMSAQGILINATQFSGTPYFNAAGDFICNDGKISGQILIFNGAGDVIENNGRISILTTNLSSSGDVNIVYGRTTEIIISLNCAGDLTLTAGRISQIYLNYVEAGDLNIAAGVYWGDTLYFNSAGDMLAQGILVSTTSFSFSPYFNAAGDFTCNDGYISKQGFSVNAYGDYTEIGGKTTSCSVTFNGAADLSCTNIRSSGQQISISCAGDCTINNIKLSGSGFSFSGSGDCIINYGRITQLIFNLNAAGDLFAYLVQATSTQFSSTAYIEGDGDLIINGAKISGSTISFNAAGDLIITLPPASAITPYILNILLHSNSIDIILHEVNPTTISF